jgi:lysophospholipase L1-like esterase
VIAPACYRLAARFDPIGLGAEDTVHQRHCATESLVHQAAIHILSKNALKSDHIHPNEAGYQLMAERIHALIQKAAP